MGNNSSSFKKIEQLPTNNAFNNKSKEEKKNNKNDILVGQDLEDFMNNSNNYHSDDYSEESEDSEETKKRKEKKEKLKKKIKRIERRKSLNSEKINEDNEDLIYEKKFKRLLKYADIIKLLIPSFLIAFLFGISITLITNFTTTEYGLFIVLIIINFIILFITLACIITTRLVLINQERDDIFYTHEGTFCESCININKDETKVHLIPFFYIMSFFVISIPIGVLLAAMIKINEGFKLTLGVSILLISLFALFLLCCGHCFHILKKSIIGTFREDENDVF